MELSVKVLDVLFRRINPERIMEQVLSGKLTTLTQRLQELFMAVAETTLQGYSADEQENIYRYAFQQGSRYCWDGETPPFFLLTECGDEVLNMMDQVPCCRYQQLLNW